MLVRLGALAIVAGLGIGALLRVLLGRDRFAALVTVAHLPLVVHAVLVLDTGRRAGIDPTVSIAFVAVAAVLLVAGIVLGRFLVPRRPWLAALTPAVTATVYLLLPALVYNHFLAQTPVRLASLPSFGYGVATLFFVCLLLPFAPGPAAGRRW